MCRRITWTQSPEDLSVSAFHPSSIIWVPVEFSGQIHFPYSYLVTTICCITKTTAARMMDTSCWILSISWTINLQLPSVTRAQIPVTLLQQKAGVSKLSEYLHESRHFIHPFPKKPLICSKMRDACSVRKGHERTDIQCFGVIVSGTRNLIIRAFPSVKHLRSLQCEQACLKRLLVLGTPSVAHLQHIFSEYWHCHSPTFSYSHSALHQ